MIDISQNTSTTAITSGVLYVVSRTEDTNETVANYYQTIFAIDVITGKGGGTGGVWTYSDITGTFTVGSTQLTFGQQHQNQRGALLAIPSLIPTTDKNPEIIITWGSHCDDTPYNGWMMAYQLSAAGTAFAQTGVWVSAPQADSTNPAGIWQGGSGPAADSTNHFYFATGNGDNNMNTSAPPNDNPTSCTSSPPCDYGDSFVKMKVSASGFSVLDFFTPYDQATRAIKANDYDLGSGGLLMVPHQSNGNPTNLLLQSGKEGWIYLVQADTGYLGGYSNPAVGPDSVIQNLNNQLYDTCFQTGVECGVWGAPGWWTTASGGGAGYVYVGGETLKLRQYLLNPGSTTTQASIGSTYTNQTSHTFGYPGPTPAVSGQSNGTNTVVWAVDTSGYKNGLPGQLYAFKATDLTCLYTTSTAADANCTRTSTADAPPGIAVKFTVPSVANGLVVMGTADTGSGGHVVIYDVSPF